MGLIESIKKVFIQDISKKQPKLVKEIFQKFILTQQYRQREDIGRWRQALNEAEDIDFPRRYSLYRIYNEITLDAHLSSLIQTRKLKVLGKEFYLLNSKGKIDEQKTKLIKKKWFNDFLGYAIESIFYGYSLVNFGDIEDYDFKGIKLVYRHHVMPEKHYILESPYDFDGKDYTNPPISNWVIGIGDERDLGLLAKACPPALFKKNVVGAWSEFAEMFGMPYRIGKTNVRDDATRKEMVTNLSKLGSAGWAVIDNEDDIEFKVNGQSDAYEVYKALIEHCNKELSKLILGATMISDDGSSRSQSEVHERVSDAYTKADLKFCKYVVDGQLIPFLNMHGFGLEGYTLGYANEEEEQIEERYKNERNKLILDAVKVATDSGLTVSPEWVQQATQIELVIPEEQPQEEGINPRLDVEYEAKANLRGSVGGVTGILELQKSVSEGYTDYGAALSMLKIIFGFSEEDAKAILGTPKATTPQAPVIEGEPSGGTDVGKSLTALTSITVSNLYNQLPTCGHKIDIRNELSLFEDSFIADYILDVFRGVFSTRKLPVKIYNAIAEYLTKGVFDGYGKTISEVDFDTPDYQMLKALRENIYVFSAAKTYQQVRELSSLMVGKDGKLVPFADFEEKARNVFDLYNSTHLQVEFEAAIGQATMAANYMQYQKDKDALPYLQYQTVGDGRVRNTHKTLDNITRRVDDPFWDEYLPLNGWGCRCTVIQLDEQEGKETDLTGFKPPKDVPDVFRMNPAKDKIIFSPKHPYFQVAKGDKDFAKKNFDLPLPDAK